MDLIRYKPLEMTNKLVPVGIARTRPVLTGNPRIDWVWVRGISNFFDWVWGCTYPRHSTRPRNISVPV